MIRFCINLIKELLEPTPTTDRHGVRLKNCISSISPSRGGAKTWITDEVEKTSKHDPNFTFVLWVNQTPRLYYKGNPISCGHHCNANETMPWGEGSTYPGKLGVDYLREYNKAEERVAALLAGKEPSEVPWLKDYYKEVFWYERLKKIEMEAELN